MNSGIGICSVFIIFNFIRLNPFQVYPGIIFNTGMNERFHDAFIGIWKFNILTSHSYCNLMGRFFKMIDKHF